jgi:hypothetical protein
MTQAVQPEVEEATVAGVSGVVVLSPSESRRLLAKAVVALPGVQAALKRGRILIANGSTNAYVVEELLGIKLDRAMYCSGLIFNGAMGVIRSEHRSNPYVLIDGKPVSITYNEVLKDFEAGDVFIKGANAVDSQGHVGILLGSDVSGTIGAAIGPIVARGAHLIVPVGLEKLVPDVVEASRRCGLKRLKYPSGATAGYFPVTTAEVVTEIQALALLTGVEATHVASGGVGGSEGSVVLVVEGAGEQVQRAMQLVESIKGEPPVAGPGDKFAAFGSQG